MSTSLAIIGTAGRGDDARQLTAAHYRMMCCVAQTVACTLGADHLVSGGSAYADHCAVDLYLAGHAKRLTLHLPCGWKDYGPDKDGRPHWAFEGTPAGQRLNQLHSAFAGVTGIDPWAQIQQAIERGAEVHVNAGGFLARNTDVAKQAGSVLAFTFGPIGNEGGTAHTWSLFRANAMAMFAHAREHYQESPCGCLDNLPGPVHAYHFDLTTRVLTRHTYEDHVTTAARAEQEAEAATERFEQAAREALNPPPKRPQRTPEEEKHDLL